MSIYKKLFEAKKEIGKISKDSTNPFFKSKYFDINGLLEHVEPILNTKELLVIQPITDDSVSTIIIDIEDGERVSSSVKLSGNKDPQKMGSEITYYRRYTLQSLLALQAEDDDGNKATLDAIKKRLEACDTVEKLSKEFKSLSKQHQEVFSKFTTELKAKLK